MNGNGDTRTALKEVAEALRHILLITPHKPGCRALPVQTHNGRELPTGQECSCPHARAKRHLGALLLKVQPKGRK